MEEDFDDGSGWQTVRYRRGRLANRELDDAYRRRGRSSDRYVPTGYSASYKPTSGYVNQVNRPASGPTDGSRYPAERPANDYMNNDYANIPTNAYRDNYQRDRQTNDYPNRAYRSRYRARTNYTDATKDYPNRANSGYNQARTGYVDTAKEYPNRANRGYHRARNDYANAADDYPNRANRGYNRARGYHTEAANDYPNRANGGYNRARFTYADATRHVSYSSQDRNPGSYFATNRSYDRNAANHNWRNYGPPRERRDRFHRRRGFNNVRAWQGDSRSRGRPGQRGPPQRRQGASSNYNRETGNSRRPQHVTQHKQNTDFVITTRTIYRYLKATHHLNNVSSQNVPQAIVKVTNLLTETIKPADLNTETGDRIKANAKEWEHNTIQTLRDHYTVSLQSNLQVLSQLQADSWQKNFDVAVIWARRHYGKKISQVTIDSAYANILNATQSHTQTRSELQSRTSTLPVENNRLVEVQDEVTATTPQPQPTLDTETLVVPSARPPSPTQDWNRIETIEETRPSTSTIQLPQRQPRTLREEMRPTPTSGPQQITVTIHRTCQDQEQQTEPPNQEQRTEPPVGGDREEPADPGPSSTHLPSLPPPPIPPPSLLSPLSSSSPLHLSNLSFIPDCPSLDAPTYQVPSELQTPAASTTTPGVLRQEPTTPTPLRIEISDTEVLEGSILDRSDSVIFTGRLPRYNLGPLKQPRVQTKLSFTPSAPHPAECTPHRHPRVMNKMSDWSLQVNRKWLIIGDSNLSRIPTQTESNIQIESYPGATFKHAEALLARTTVSKDVERVILSFGINSKYQKETTTAPELKKAIKMAEIAFPEARILVPIVNHHRDLSTIERNNLADLNSHIVCHPDSIPQLSKKLFDTEGDLVHWTEQTAQHMFDHWVAHLNRMSP